MTEDSVTPEPGTTPRGPDKRAVVAAVTTQPVRGMTTTRMRAARVRWAIAALVTIVVLAVSAGGFMILSAGAATSALVGYVPANSVAYLEVRLDAPGDQHQNAANLLSHFPGFADQSTLGTKLDQALDQLVGNVTSGRQTFTGSIKPWLGDSIAIVHTRLPGATAASGTDAPRQKNGLVLVSVSDPAAARAWANGTFGPATGSQTYSGIPLTSIEEHGSTVAFGVISNVLLMGDPDSVHAAIDTKGGSPFGDSASFKAAAASVSGDRLAFGFLDVRQVTQAIDSTGSRSALAAKLTLEQLPAWVAVSMRAESDGVNATVALPDTNLAPVAANHSSILATKLPGTTIAAGEIHDLASVISTVTTTLSGPTDASPSASPSSAPPDPIGQALQAVGGIDGLVGWMGDGTVAVVRTGGASSIGEPDVAVGAVIQAKDADTADAKITQLKNLVSLAGSSLGVKLTDETYTGATITLIDLGALGQFAAGRLPAAAAGAIGSTGGSLSSLKIAIAQRGDLVIVGLGDGFVKAVLDTQSGQTLADQDSYRNALDKAGASNTGQLYVDLAGVLDVAAEHMSAAQLQSYQSDIKPYLEPFRAFAAAGSAGDPNRARFVITVR